MKVVPSIEEVRAYAAEGKYDIVPVSTEILSDFTTPIETIRILKNASTHAYMLESAQSDEKWGRYTFLGFDPKLEITCINGEITYFIHRRSCRLFLLRLPGLCRTHGKM